MLAGYFSELPTNSRELADLEAHYAAVEHPPCHRGMARKRTGTPFIDMLVL